MILTALVKRYEQQLNEGKVVARGWSMADISFGLRLYENGEIADIIDRRAEVESNKKKYLKAIKRAVPEQGKRTSGIVPYFLCDNAKYFLGIDGNTEQFKAAKNLHLEILKNCDSVAVRAIKNFFEHWNPSDTIANPKLQDYLEELRSGARLIFMFEKKFATEYDEIKLAWENYRQNQEESASMQCSITGKFSPIAKIHPSIKGVMNANSSGGSIVSFNASAFESYGHDDQKGLNAPISKYATFAYTTALNDLLADKNHVKVFGDMTVVYWAEENNEQCQNSLDGLLFSSEEKISSDTLDEIMKGIKEKNISFNGTELSFENPFYILGLSPNNARISVRLFLQKSFGETVKNIAKHYEDLRIVKPVNEPDYLPLWRILRATIPSQAKEKKSTDKLQRVCNGRNATIPSQAKEKKSSPLMTGAVVKSIMSGQNYPVSLLQNTLLRIRADHAVTYERAAIIKAYLTRNKRRENLMSLDENATDVSYVYGRIFAVLERVQKKANPGIDVTIKDKYFTSACAIPTRVFPTLLKLSVHHLSKLDTRRIYWEKQLTSLIGKLSPSIKNLSTLTQEEQGMFILGYYHQVQELNKEKESKENV